MNCNWWPSVRHRGRVWFLLTTLIIVAVLTSACGNGFEALLHHSSSTKQGQPGTVAGNGHVYLVPLDDFPVASAQQLAGYFQHKYDIPITVLARVSLPDSAWDEQRGQVIAELALSAMQAAHPDIASQSGTVMIGLTPEDIYMQSEPDWLFAFSYRHENHLAVVSQARMWIGASSNPTLADTRLQKMVTKDIGLMYFHLQPSSNPHSVLYDNIGGLEELDAMGEDF